MDLNLISCWRVTGVSMVADKMVRLIGGWPGDYVEFTEDGRYRTGLTSRLPLDSYYLVSTSNQLSELDVWIRGLEPLRTLCVYHITGNELEICIAGDSGERPTELRRDDDRLWCLMTLERSEPPKLSAPAQRRKPRQEASLPKPEMQISEIFPELAYPTLVGPLTEARLERFEDRLGRRLPADYRRFLLQFNGGVPHNTGLRFFNEVDEEWTETVFECYYPLHDADIPHKAKWRFHRSLEEIWEDIQQDPPPSTTIVPIGSDAAGNLICIETNGAETGYIFFWDHDYNALYALARSLAEFHANLTESDDVQEPPSVWEHKGL